VAELSRWATSRRVWRSGSRLAKQSPPGSRMGSGNFCQDVAYFPTGGGRAAASLTPSQASANCFTINVPVNLGAME
jgi:hypothetical protein